MTSKRIDGNKLRGVMASMAAAVILVSSSAALAASLSGPGVAAVVNGRVEIDGKPFFPFGFYHVTHAGTEANLYNTLNLVSSAGFNTLHAGTVYPIDHGRFLDTAAQQGVRVITEFGNSPEKLTQLITNYGGKPAVLGWNVADDVDDGTKTHDQVLALYNQAKTSDPRHLPYISGFHTPNQPGPGGVTIVTFMDVTNLLGMQRYPISYGPVRIVWQANAGIVDAARPRGLPVIANLQAFNWNDSTNGNRFPTPAEGRNMTYQAIAAGVKGIIYYTFFDGGNYLPTGSPPLWAELKALVPEVNVLAPALLSGQMTSVGGRERRPLRQLLGLREPCLRDCSQHIDQQREDVFAADADGDTRACAAALFRAPLGHELLERRVERYVATARRARVRIQRAIATTGSTRLAGSVRSGSAP